MNPPPAPIALRVVVYCGSRHGRQPQYTQAARRLGTLIGQRGWQLAYGGGKVGLMGEVAEAVLAAGGRVTGVITQALMRREVGHTGLHELHVVDTMHQRKQQMAEGADLFIALPGGVGTLEELYEVWTWRQLGYHDRPIGLLNTGGYYDPLLQFMQHATSEGFLAADHLRYVHVGDDETLLLDALAAEALASRRVGADLTRI